MSFKSLPDSLTVDAQPYAFSFPPRHTALLVIDMQRDFLLEGGFGAIQGGDLTHVQASIEPTKRLLDLFRHADMHVFHTREGHKPDLSDCPSSKLIRQAAHPENTQHGLVIGDKGAMGRLLTRGEYGHDLIDELQPVPGEVVIDKPGKGAFWNTDLMLELRARAITHLVVAGVTSECCFQGTIREGNDRGFECCGVIEATAGYLPALKEATLKVIPWSQGLFGFVGGLDGFEKALGPYCRETPSASTMTPPATPPEWDGDISLGGLTSAYRRGLSPVTVVQTLYKKIEAYAEKDPAVWIHLQPLDVLLDAARQLQTQYPDRTRLPPLFGIPFSIKDSFDVRGLKTTTACPPLAFTAEKSAIVFEKVVAEGALFIGKANLDQLATGLSGCRSPFGIPRSIYHKEYISGGSSSGNAVSVGAGLVTFAIATDTAGSGRVPALFNGVVGFKPTRGTISARGLTPACASLDCVTLMAKNVEEVRRVWNICTGYDEEYVYAKRLPARPQHINSLGSQAKAFTFGCPPPEVLAVCSPVYQRMFDEAIQVLQSIGGVRKPLDWSPFEQAGKLLYDGTLVSERLASLPDGWFEANKDDLNPTIRELFANVINRQSTAVQVFRDLQAMALYTRQAERIFDSSAVGPYLVVVPSAPTHYKVSEMLADPIAKNSTLGTFTQFANVLDLNGLAVPAGTYAESELSSGGGETRLPFGITLLGGSQTDAELLEIGRRFGEAMNSAN